MDWVLITMSPTPLAPETIAPWHTIGIGEEHDWKVMRIHTEHRRHARDGREGVFTIANAPHWVNIIPVTTDGLIVLVEQFRHGTGSVSLEIPGGVANSGEDPRAAAERECAEETGWVGNSAAELLGVVQPNPAFMSNTCSMFIWHDCSYQGAQSLDPLEDIRVVVMSPADLLANIESGTICHSLVLSAFALALVQSQLTLGSLGRNNG